MTRLMWSGVLLAWAACTTSQPEAPAEPDRPNVLFVFYDQYRPDIIGAYGGGKNITTPNLDRLAQEGVLFTNALSTTPVCTPYRGMLMTGRYPTHTGIMLNFLEANTSQTNIADVFSEAGYRTAFMGKWHLAAGGFKKAWVGEEDGSWDYARPYMEENPNYDFVPPGPARLGFEDWAAYNFHVDFLAAPYYKNEPKKLIMDGYESNALTDMAIAYMEEARGAGEPFFIMVAPHPPHPPFDRLPEGYLERVPETLHWDDNVPEEMKTGKNLAEARAYYAMAKNAEDNMGRLLDYLDESGLTDDTIVVFTSDHGEMLGSHGRRSKRVPYDEAVQVPLLIRWPGHLASGSRTDTLQTPLDHMPTLIAIAGLRAPQGLDGIDLSNELLDGQTVERNAALMSNYTADWDFFTTASQANANRPEWRGVKTKQYTYARWIDGETALYDDLADPDQLTDLSDDPANTELVDELEVTLQKLLAEAHDEFLPGNAYVEWVDRERNIIKTGLGPVTE